MYPIAFRSASMRHKTSAFLTDPIGCGAFPCRSTSSVLIARVAENCPGSDFAACGLSAVHAQTPTATITALHRTNQGPRTMAGWPTIAEFGVGTSLLTHECTLSRLSQLEARIRQIALKQHVRPLAFPQQQLSTPHFVFAVAVAVAVAF